MEWLVKSHLECLTWKIFLTYWLLLSIIAHGTESGALQCWLWNRCGVFLSFVLSKKGLLSLSWQSDLRAQHHHWTGRFSFPVTIRLSQANKFHFTGLPFHQVSIIWSLLLTYSERLPIHTETEALVEKRESVITQSRKCERCQLSSNVCF